MDYNHSEDHNHCNFHKNIHKSGNMIVHHLNRFPRNFPVQIDTPQKIHHTSRRTQLNNLQVHRDLPAVLEALVVPVAPAILAGLGFLDTLRFPADHWRHCFPCNPGFQFHLGFLHNLECPEILGIPHIPDTPADPDCPADQTTPHFLEILAVPENHANPPDLATPMIHFFRLVASKEPIH